MNCMALSSRENVLFLRLIGLFKIKYSAFTALKGMESSKQGM